MATVEDYLSALVEQKNALADILVEKGIEANTSEKFNTLIPKVADIESGGVYKNIHNTRTLNGTKFDYYYNQCAANQISPDLDLSNCTSAAHMFYYSKMVNMPQYDFSKCTNLNYAFNQCTLLETIPIMNTVKCRFMQVTFGACSKLKSIEGISFTGLADGGGVRTFEKCTSLTHVRCIGETVNSISFSASPLDLESGKDVLLSLNKFTGSNAFKYTIGLSESTWELLDTEGEASPDGTTWRDYVTAKGWNY